MSYYWVAVSLEENSIIALATLPPLSPAVKFAVLKYDNLDI